MATDIRTLPAFFSTDADFRAWGSGIAAQLAVVGLVQTSDTGQINWTTVARPVTTNGLAGYEVWRFNDALQATKPVFIKLEYGVGQAGNTQSMGMRVTVGTGTDGAGNLTGQVGVMSSPQASSIKSAGVILPSYCSGSSSRLSLCTNLDAASASFGSAVLIERTKTAAGVDTNNGIVTLVAGATGFLRDRTFQVIPFSGSVPSPVNVNMAASLSFGVSSVGANVALSPTVAPLGKLFFASWAAYLHADLGELVPVTADHLGASRTMLPLGDGLITAATVQGTATGHSIAILWE